VEQDLNRQIAQIAEKLKAMKQYRQETEAEVAELARLGELHAKKKEEAMELASQYLPADMEIANNELEEKKEERRSIEAQLPDDIAQTLANLNTATEKWRATTEALNKESQKLELLKEEIKAANEETQQLAESMRLEVRANQHELQLQQRKLARMQLLVKFFGISSTVIYLLTLILKNPLLYGFFTALGGSIVSNINVRSIIGR